MKLNKKVKIDYIQALDDLLQKKPVKISCVVPIFNEDERMSVVVNLLVKYKNFTEVILVNDGSTDNTKEMCEVYAKKYSHVKFINNEVNMGKTKAVKRGVDESMGDLIVLIDADLKGLDDLSIAKMLYFVVNGEFDMTILDRGGDRRAIVGPFQSWMARFNGGERTFWKSEFNKVEFPKGTRYGIEQILNLHYLKNQLKVRTIYCPNLLCTYQFKKRGFIKGLMVYKKMFVECYKTSKVEGYYVQVRDVVEDRIEPFYKFYDRTKHKKLALSGIILSGLFLSVFTFFKLNSQDAIKAGQKRIKNPIREYDL